MTDYEMNYMGRAGEGKKREWYPPLLVMQTSFLCQHGGSNLGLPLEEVDRHGEEDSQLCIGCFCLADVMSLALHLLQTHCQLRRTLGRFCYKS
eukprot:scaffold869_cov160-Ochromonas_danica.AAC.8